MLRELAPWAAAAGLRLAWTDNARPNVDVWNAPLLAKLNLTAAATAAAMSMDEVANVSVVNLQISAHAGALVGTFHSSWARLMAAANWAEARRPPLLLNLKASDARMMGVHSGPLQAEWEDGHCFPAGWACPARPGLLCRHRDGGGGSPPG